MKADDDFLKLRRWERMVAPAVSLCAAAIDIAGEKLTPDESKAYVQFGISQGLQVSGAGGQAMRGVTAYRTAMHPGTVANSFSSLRHQVFNEGHLMKAYDPDSIARDHIIGSVVAVEFPAAPSGGWTIQDGDVSGGSGTVASDYLTSRVFPHGQRPNPQIRAAAVIHKSAQGVPKILGEHLGGRHKWTVSQEVDYSLAESGFVVGERDRAKKKQEELLAGLTPDEFSGLGLGFVPCMEAPDEMLECYNPKKRMVDKSWDGLPLVLLKGGVNGRVHYKGTGLVRYGAEREAEIQQLLASDPNAVGELEEAGLAEFFGLLTEFAERVQEACRVLAHGRD